VTAATADVRRAATEADLEAYCRVWNTLTPREPVTPADVRRRLERQPERLYLVASEDGAAVACALAGPSDSPGRAFISVRVLPEQRGRGLGDALLERCEAHARRRGAEFLSGHVCEDDAAARAWAARHGYQEVGRQVELVRRLGHDEQSPAAPPGIGIVELTDELRDGAYAVAREAWPDMPTPTPMQAPPYEEWLEEDLRGPIAFAAVDGERVVGYASLARRDANGELLEHGLTAVLRSHRRRGIATALKQAQIGWAAAHGYRELVTFTQDANVGMQAVNAALGYLAQPGWLTVRRPA